MSLAVVDIDVALAGRAVLSDVTVDCRAGRITGLIGPNGAGKSTLLRAMAGLVSLERGAITVDGVATAEMPARERGRRIAYLPQNRAVHWPLAAWHVVALGRLPHGGSGDSSDDRRAIAIAMAEMDVSELAARPVSELSGGELARVLFARALAQEAPVILADEPTTGLDPAHALALFEVLKRLAAGGRTLVVALHDLSLAARFCHEVVVLAHGRVAAAGPTADVLTAERLDGVFGVRMAIGSVAGIPAVVPLSPLPSKQASGIGRQA